MKVCQFRFPLVGTHNETCCCCIEEEVIVVCFVAFLEIHLEGQRKVTAPQPIWSGLGYYTI